MAGLAAGTYLRMNGYETTILEMNQTPGGLCTSWDRNGYKIDLCIHWLVGSGPGSSFFERWNELIHLNDIEFINHEEYFRMEDAQGHAISVYTDIDRLEKEFLTKAPEDADEILKFMKGVRKLMGFDAIPGDEANLWSKMKSTWKVLPYLGTFGRFMRYTCQDYSKKFKNPLLRRVIARLFEPGMSIVFAMMVLTWFHKKTAGYPVGGSLNFAMKVYDRYNELGGKIQFESKVVKILTENDAAVGVELSSGEKRRADYVISAADGYTTIFVMLNGWYLSEKLLRFYKKAKPFPSLVFISMGVRRTFEGMPNTLGFPLDKAMYVDPKTTINDLAVRINNFDATLAPSGCTLLTVMIETDNYNYWNNLHHDNHSQYSIEKERIANEVIEVLDKRLGKIRENLEMVDVSTPVTFRSFSGNWKGSFEGWLMTPETGFRNLPHHLPGLKNFYMCGQWVAIGGGLPGVLSSGREAAQLICHDEGKPFQVIPAEKEAMELAY